MRVRRAVGAKILAAAVVLVLEGCDAAVEPGSESTEDVVAVTGEAAAEGPTEEPETTEEIPLGFEPVAHNADWAPITEVINGVEMALVPAGCFMMGSAEEEIDDALELCEAYLGDCDRALFEGEAPQHEVCFEEPFWIDVTEVTNEAFGSVGCEEFSSEPDQPRNCVNWTDASAHCEARGARLPTEAEWEYAARGPDGLAFPWGNTFDGTLANYCDANCENDWADATADDGFPTTAPVGSYLGSASWVGALDMSGNVWEWMADWFGAYSSGRQVNPQGPGSGDLRVLRGGSWPDDPKNLRGAYRFMDLPVGAAADLGFRCARDFDPANVTP